MSSMPRREFLRWASVAVTAIGLAACQQAAPAAPAAPTAAPAAKPTTPPGAATNAPAPTAAAAAKPTAAPTTAPAAAAAAGGGTLVYGLSFDVDDTLDLGHTFDVHARTGQRLN